MDTNISSLFLVSTGVFIGVLIGAIVVVGAGAFLIGYFLNKKRTEKKVGEFINLFKCPDIAVKPQTLTHLLFVVVNANGAGKSQSRNKHTATTGSKESFIWKTKHLNQWRREKSKVLSSEASKMTASCDGQ